METGSVLSELSCLQSQQSTGSQSNTTDSQLGSRALRSSGDSGGSSVVGSSNRRGSSMLGRAVSDLRRARGDGHQGRLLVGLGLGLDSSRGRSRAVGDLRTTRGHGDQGGGVLSDGGGVSRDSGGESEKSDGGKLHCKD